MKRILKDIIFLPTQAYETQIGYQVAQVVGFQGSSAKEERSYLIWKVGLIVSFLLSYYLFQQFNGIVLAGASFVLFCASVIVLLAFRPHQEYRVRNFVADFDRNTIVMKVALTGYDDVIFNLHENGFFSWDGRVLSYRYGLKGANSHPNIKFPIKGIETKNYGQKTSNPDEITGLVSALNHVHELTLGRPTHEEVSAQNSFNPMD